MTVELPDPQASARMTSHPLLVALPVGRILWLGSVLLIAALFLDIPVEIHLSSASIQPEPENGYVMQLPELFWPLLIVSDGPDAPRASGTELLEDQRRLGPAHSGHASIRHVGRGRYSHWRGALYFSTSDNSDPRVNGRQYVAIVRVRLSSAALLAAYLGLGAIALAHWLHRGPIELSDLFLPAGLLAGAGLSLGLAALTGDSFGGEQTGGVLLWLFLGLAAVSMVWAVMALRLRFTEGVGKPLADHRLCGSWETAKNATLLMASLTVALVGAEVLLLTWERRAFEALMVPTETHLYQATVEPRDLSGSAGRHASTVESETDPLSMESALKSFGVSVPREALYSATRRSALLTLPPELDRVAVEVEGAVRAYRWHGVLHLKNPDNMRRVTPFPPRQEHVFRLMVVGDSVTYGEGIDEQWTYPRQLEARLEPDYDIEVLNLGISGHQSEDILGTVREFLPRLRPDLVVYGVCTNDFLPSGMSHDRNYYAYAIPLPKSVKTFLTSRSRLVRLIEDAYGQALFSVGLRGDFFDEILNDFTVYQRRFAQDVARMNELVEAHGLPPVVAFVLDPHPVVGSRGHRIVQAAEKYLRNAGMDLIEMDPYYLHFNGSKFQVSRWEGHPNEIANAIWTAMLKRHLRELPILDEYRNRDGRIKPPG